MRRATQRQAPLLGHEVLDVAADQFCDHHAKDRARYRPNVASATEMESAFGISVVLVRTDQQEGQDHQVDELLHERDLGSE